MKTYADYQNQIQGFTDVLDTVKAVEKIAASSIHVLKQEVTNLNLYGQAIETILSRLSRYTDHTNHLLLQTRPGKKAIIVLTGDKGLVGGLWHTLTNSVLDQMHTYDWIIVVGVKGRNYLIEEHVSINQFFPDGYEIRQSQHKDDLSKYIFQLFQNGAVTHIDILYPQFVSLTAQEPSCIQFLPFAFKNFPGDTTPDGLPLFEPRSKEHIFDQLLEKYVSVSLSRILMETKLSELSARTVATERASSKTEDMVHKLKFAYTKERHRSATQQQLESFSVHTML